MHVGAIEILLTDRDLINRWWDIAFQILCGSSLGISDDLINFWEELIKNRMAD